MKAWNAVASLALAALFALPATAQNQEALKILGEAALEIGPANIYTGPQDDLISLDRGTRSPKPNIVNAASTSNAAAATIPKPQPQRIVGAGFARGFQGLTNYQQRASGTGAYVNTQFDLEPPDQALCAGNGFVMEAINNAIEVFDTRGNVISGPTPLSQFYNLLPEINRTTLVYGQFLSDPRCYYDASTHRWFVTELEIDIDPTSGDFGNKSSVLIAVSKTANPVGKYTLYSFDTSDTRNSAHPLCPCFGDQPLIGADANGFYVTTNEFPITAAGFYGAQIYALSKAKLESGSLGPVVHIDAGAIPTPSTDGGNLWYSVHPAATQGWGWNNLESEDGGGVEYFLSSLQFVTAFDNRVAVWALTNTASLNSRAPNVALLHTVIGVESYGISDAFGASQKSGPTPLLDALAEGDTLNLLNANDDRMNQVAYVNGKLWSGVNTNVSVQGRTRQGIAWFEVQPGLRAGQLFAYVVNQGYVAVAGEDVLFPSIDMNQQGQAVMSFTLTGPDLYPSSAFTYIGRTAGDVHVLARGVGPDDGFTGYVAFQGNGIARWGDYSSAAADEWGNIWVASEYIGQRCTDAQFLADNTCGGTRTTFANWGTFIGSVPTGY